VAIILVVLFHANVPGVTGGFVGVDVFFVLSGFVITGLLLREHASTGKTRLLSFYGRRSRRILPAATLVIILTVLSSYKWLGFLTGDQSAITGRTASLFYANFHFIATGTNYLASQAPPSALQNFWSLSVEEQFYVLYPTLFLLAALLWKRVDIRLKLTVLLSCSIIASFIWSIQQTATNSTAAFFSPFTRAWELALGALVAVASPQLARIPRPVAMAMTWIGLAGILVAAFVYTSSTSYPGSAVALPVLSTAMIVAAGMARPTMGAEIVLRQLPFQWMGKLSYGLYLWHWPILIIASQHVGHPLSVTDNLLWVLVALGLSICSYFLIENPIRHWKFLARSGGRSVALGLILIGLSLAVATFEIASHP
jgi:peptidoglycan/LPS O-acetylase OafA/YrhL